MRSKLWVDKQGYYRGSCLYQKVAGERLDQLEQQTLPHEELKLP